MAAFISNIEHDAIVRSQDKSLRGINSELQKANQIALLNGLRETGAISIEAYNKSALSMLSDVYGCKIYE